MKIKFTHLLFLLLSMCFQNGHSQGVDINSVAEKFFVSLNLNPVLNNIDLSNPADKNSDFAEQAMINPSFAADYMFSSKIGIRAGIGISFYRKNALRDSTMKTIQGTDTDNDQYSLYVIGHKISEKNKIFNASIPLGVVFMQPLFNKIGLYVVPGVSISIPVYANYTGSGTYNFEAFYPEYNLTLKDIPEHGLYKDKLIEGDKRPDIASLLINGCIDAGLSYKIKRDFSVLLGFHYSQGFGNILKSRNDGLTPPTLPYSSVPEYKSIIESNKEAKLQSYGLQISLRYLIK